VRIYWPCCFILTLIVTIYSVAQTTGPSGTISGSSHVSILAETPPMGWNSWDGYGTTVNEAQVKANAKWVADHLKEFGWQYVVVDMEWFVTNPIAEGNSRTSQYSLDQYGRFVPAVNRFPSSANGAGFKPLADYVHSLGLRFGIHILRGIPKQAVVNKIPIEGTNLSAADGANTADTCPWNFDYFGTNPTSPAAQAYYDSIAKLYKEWGVDLIKVDCISSNPYSGEDIRMIREALDKTGRSIALSLSPGPAPVDKLDEMRKYAQMWRISNDIWDIWHNDGAYPKGLHDQFEYVAHWAGKAQPGAWPDADMLPLGRLGPAPGWGEPRNTRLSKDEQRMLMTLWVIFPSPLMVGGELPSADQWTISLLTNPEVIDVDQHSTDNHNVLTNNDRAVWTARSTRGKGQYVALFNLSDSKQEFNYSWESLGVAPGKNRVRDLWEHKDLGLFDTLLVKLPPRGSVLYTVAPVQ